MRVRCWVMIGPEQTIHGLLQSPERLTHHLGAVPDATAYTVGQAILWTPAPGSQPVCLVCVEIPM